MNKNTQTETAKNSQAVEKSKTPTGKVTTIEQSKARKKAREEQYRNFRINALKRRCERMGISDEETEKLVEKLKTQLDAPKEYSILVICYKSGDMMMEALKNAKINYKFHGDTFFWIEGDQKVLAKIREIAPNDAKIHPYAKKMESIIPKNIQKKEKKPTNNTPEKKEASKTKRKAVNLRRANHKKSRGKKMAKYNRKISLAKRKKQRSNTVVRLSSKKGSKSLKKASKGIKKAA